MSKLACEYEDKVRFIKKHQSNKNNTIYIELCQGGEGGMGVYVQVGRYIDKGV